MLLVEKKEKKNINSLTATRAFAALLIVVYHFANVNTGIPYIDRFFKNGNLAVSYFFVLSGYIMYLSYTDNYKGYKNFIQRRVARIVPLYWFALIMATLLVLIITKFSPDKELLFAFLSNATFTQVSFDKYIYSLNTPGWSLCVEMSFYLLFPFLLQFQKSRNKLFIWFTIVLYVASAIIHQVLVDNFLKTGKLEILAYYKPYLHFNQFLVGMLAAQLFSKSVKSYSFLPVISLAVILLFMCFDFGISAHDGLLAPVFALFIGSLATSEPSFLKIKPLVFLGEISYGIYILQRPVHNFYNQIYFRFSSNKTAGFFIYFFALIAISAFLYYIVEKPCQRWINNLGNKNKKPDIPELKMQPEVLTEA
jgi:peptidoglycan/LPS O-acetylase OafA/YrhL